MSMMVRLGVAMLMVWMTSLAWAVTSDTPTEDFTDNGDGTVTHKITGRGCAVRWG